MKAEALANQKRAADFNISSWVVASAGSGKTKILTDRVLNLLLQGTAPEKILCLTFTKAAAKEMIERISSVLSSWVVIGDKELEQTISQLHPEFAEVIELKSSKYTKLMSKARTLFAETIEVSGGMKIMTIHGFCQSVLKRFPIEAKVSPYFEVIEEAISYELMEKSRYEVMEDDKNLDFLNIISNYVNEDDFIKSIRTLQKDKDSLSEVTQNAADNLKRVLEINSTDTQQVISDFIKEHRIILDNIIVAFNNEPKYVHLSIVIDDFLNTQSNLKEFFSIFLTATGALLKRPNKIITEISDTISESVQKLYADLSHIKIYDCSFAFISIASEIITRYERYKNKECLLDYDDLIIKTKDLLSNHELSPWVLYKLDGGIDHILVDEAQDTSPKQWAIIKALTEEIFSGLGSKDYKRTLFVVGDRKQSIYSFQGANIETFDNMRQFFASKITEASSVFEEIPINISFRSTPEVLSFVDMVFSTASAKEGVLLSDEDLQHIPFYSEGCGKVEIWDLCDYDKEDQAIEEEFWQLPTRKFSKPSPKEQLALKVALEIKDILATKYLPVKRGNIDTYRKVEPKDIMILVRSRSEIATSIISTLKALKVPVAGIDRLSLLEHIAVKDLISLSKFLLYPDDDLSLAEVLKSPLIGIEEQELFSLSYGREKQSIWQRIKDTNHSSFAYLSDLLKRVDFISPFSLYNYILNVKQGREKITARLGEEALDALDEFLNLVKNYTYNNISSMQNLLNYLEQNKVEIKREQEQLNQVRLLTVHGSKGLQAPIVFLPDTTSMNQDNIRVLWLNGLPLWIPQVGMASERLKYYIDKEKEIERKEYRRLLYVAMTRAAEELYICGYNHKKSSPKGNWYDLISSAISVPEYMDKFIKTTDNRLVLQYNTANIKHIVDSTIVEEKEETKPLWMTTLPPQDDALKPLAPSHIDEEDIIANSPLFLSQEHSYLKGIIVHKILQYLPEISQDKWFDYIKAFLRSQPSSDFINQQIINSIDKLIQDSQFLSLVKSGMAEVPICGVVEGNIINGQIDKLLITPTEVVIVDYKSNSRVPNSIEDIPLSYKKQMSNYRKVMEKIYPNHKISTYLLWLENVSLMEVK